tara:strand:- start:1720 stop:2157 length:438 start_codon:yes stop_codon:yes gene_type:complete
MSWKKIVKAKGRSNVEFDDRMDFQIGQSIARELNLLGEDNYDERFEVSMDNFSIDIEVSNVEQKLFDDRFPSETFAIRVKPEGKIELYDNELDSVVKVFTEKDIIINLDGSKPKPMEDKSGAFLFTTTYKLGDYDNGKITVDVEI